MPVLTGEVNEELFSKLLELMRKRGVPVSFESRPQLPTEVKGEYTPAGIWIRPEEPGAQQLKTLLHEVLPTTTPRACLASREGILRPVLRVLPLSLGPTTASTPG